MEQGDTVFWWGWYPTEGWSSNFWSSRWSSPTKVQRLSLPRLEEHPHFSITKILSVVLNLVIVINFKKMSESIFFQSIKFAICNVKGGKEVANFLVVFNILKIIHPFQTHKNINWLLISLNGNASLWFRN